MCIHTHVTHAQEICNHDICSVSDLVGWLSRITPCQDATYTIDCIIPWCLCVGACLWSSRVCACMRNIPEIAKLPSIMLDSVIQPVLTHIFHIHYDLMCVCTYASTVRLIIMSYWGLTKIWWACCISRAPRKSPHWRRCRRRPRVWDQGGRPRSCPSRPSSWPLRPVFAHSYVCVCVCT